MACLSKLHSSYLLKHFEKKLFWKTNETFHHFQALSRKFSASCRVFRRGCWKCNIRVQSKFLTKNSFISNFFFFFGHTDIFLTNSRRKSRLVVETGFSVLKKTFGWKFFAKLTNCYFFEHRAGNFWLAVQNKSAGLSSCFVPLLGNFLNKIFLKSFCTFCGPCFRSFPVIEQEKLGRPVNTAFFLSIKSIWKKKLFWKTIDISRHFQTMSRKISASCRVFDGMLELHSTCPRYHFNEERFCF